MHLCQHAHTQLSTDKCERSGLNDLTLGTRIWSECAWRRWLSTADTRTFLLISYSARDINQIYLVSYASELLFATPEIFMLMLFTQGIFALFISHFCQLSINFSATLLELVTHDSKDHILHYKIRYRERVECLSGSIFRLWIRQRSN